MISRCPDHARESLSPSQRLKWWVSLVRALKAAGRSTAALRNQDLLQRTIAAKRSDRTYDDVFPNLNQDVATNCNESAVSAS